MNFLRQLFGGGGGEQRRDDGMYYYLRARRSGEIVQVRLDPNQLSPQYDGDRVGSYFTAKTVIGPRSFERMEAEFHFDGHKHLVDKSVSGGEFVTRDDWEAQQAGDPT